MLHKLQKGLPTAKQVLLEQICCRKYSLPIRNPVNKEHEGWCSTYSRTSQFQS